MASNDLQLLCGPLSGEPPLESLSDCYLHFRFFRIQGNTGYAFFVEDFVQNGNIEIKRAHQSHAGAKHNALPDFTFSINDVVRKCSSALTYDVFYRCRATCVGFEAKNVFRLVRGARAVRPSLRSGLGRPWHIQIRSLEAVHVVLNWQESELELFRRICANNISMFPATTRIRAISAVPAPLIEHAQREGYCTAISRTPEHALTQLCWPSMTIRAHILGLLESGHGMDLGVLAQAVAERLAFGFYPQIREIVVPFKLATENVLLSNIFARVQTCVTATSKIAFGIFLDTPPTVLSESSRHQSFFDFAMNDGELRAVFTPTPLLQTGMLLSSLDRGAAVCADGSLFISCPEGLRRVARHTKLEGLPVCQEDFGLMEVTRVNDGMRLPLHMSATFSNLKLKRAYFDGDATEWTRENLLTALSLTQRSVFIFKDRKSEHAEALRALVKLLVNTSS